MSLSGRTRPLSKTGLSVVRQGLEKPADVFKGCPANRASPAHVIRPLPRLGLTALVT